MRNIVEIKREIDAILAPIAMSGQQRTQATAAILALVNVCQHEAVTTERQESLWFLFP